MGHPRISLQASLFGALLMPLAFLVGVRWGATGLAFAWLRGVPAGAAVRFRQARRRARHRRAPALGLALAPGLRASAAMALPVVALGHALADWQPWARLAAQVATGGLTYAAVLFVASRATLDELVLLRRPPPARGAARRVSRLARSPERGRMAQPRVTESSRRRESRT